MKSDLKNVIAVWGTVSVIVFLAAYIGSRLYDPRPTEINVACVFAGRVNNYPPSTIRFATTYQDGNTVIEFHTGLTLKFSSAIPCVIASKRVPMLIDHEVGG